MLARVGAMEDAEATERLTSTINGFKMSVEGAAHAVNAYVAVDLAAATSVSELAEAMSRTANMADDMGISFDKMNGYIASVSESTRRSASSVGEAFKSLLSRFTKIKVGSFVDDADVQELNDVNRVLDKIGITLIDSEGKWRNVGTVLDELSVKWETLEDKEKNAIATAIAGQNQAETFRALMNNYERAMELAEISTNAAGTAAEKFDIYLDSLKSKSNIFKATWQDMVYNETTVKWFGNVIDAGTKLLNILDAIVKNPLTNFILQATAASVAVGLLGSGVTKAAGYVEGFMNAIKTGKELSTLQTYIYAVTSGVSTLGGAIKALTAEMLASPLFWAAAAGLAITGIIKLYQHFTTENERLTQAIKDNTATYEALQSELKELEDELVEVKNRMHELQTLSNNGEITLVEQAELSNLREASKLIEQKIKLKQLEADVANKELLKSAEEYYKKLKKFDQDSIDSQKNKGTYLEKWNEDNVNSLIAQRENIKTLIDKTPEGSVILDSINDQLADNTDLMLKLIENNIEAAETFRLMGDEARALEIESINDILFKEIDPSSFGIDKFNELWNNVDFEGVRSRLEELGKSGKVTPQTINSIAEFRALMEETGITAEEIANQINSDMGLIEDSMDDVADSAGNASKAFSDIKDEIDNFSESSNLFNTVNEEISEFGSISIDTLSSLVDKYSELEEPLAEYAMGLRDIESVYEAISVAYEADQENFYNALLAKMGNSEVFYNSVLANNVETVNKIAEYYGHDVTQYKTYNEAKIKLSSAFSQFVTDNQDIIGRNLLLAYGEDSEEYQGYLSAKADGDFEVIKYLSMLWAEYYDIQSDTLTEEGQRLLDKYNEMVKKHGPHVDIDFNIAEGIATLDQMKGEALDAFNALDALNGISYEAVALSADNLSSSLNGVSDSADRAASSAKSAADYMEDLINLTVKMLKQNAKDKKKALQDELSDLKESYNDRKALLKEEYDDRKDALKDQYDALKKLLEKQYKAEKEYIEKIRDTEVKAIEDRIDAYERLINAKLDALRKDEDEHDYQAEVSKRLKEISDLQNNINNIANDTSSAGIKKRLELEAELAEKQASLAEYQHDRGIQLQQEALEAELERYKESMEANKEAVETKYNDTLEALEKEYEANRELAEDNYKYQADLLENWYKTKSKAMESDYKASVKDLERRIADVDDYLSKEGALRKEAIDMIQNNSEELYKQLIEYNKQYGTGVNETIDELWKNSGMASNAILGYQNQIVGGLGNISSAAKNATSDFYAMAAAAKAAASAFAKAKAEEDLHHYYSQDEIDAGVGSFHTGGFVKANKSSNWQATLFNGLKDGLKSDEILAKLQDGEFVATKDHQKKLTEMVLNSNTNTERIELGNSLSVGSLMNINVQGNMDKSVIPKIKEIASGVMKEIDKIADNRGTSRNAKFGFI